VDIVAFDTETHLIGRGCLAPPRVCLSLSWLNGPSMVVANDSADYDFGRVLDTADVVVGHNTAYDLAVMARTFHVERIFEAIDAGKLSDTAVRERLIRNAFGEFKFCNGRPTLYSLAALVGRYLNIDITEDKKNPNAWRMRYPELEHIPVSEWPADAVSYARMDAVYTGMVYAAQREQNPDEVDGYPLWETDAPHAVVSERNEIAAAFALHLMAVWGLRTDTEAVTRTIAEWKAGSEAGVTLGRALGFIRPNGTKDTKRLKQMVTDAYSAIGQDVPTTDKGNVQYSEEVLSNSGDADLVKYGESLHFTNWLSKYAAVLEMGTTFAITSKPNHMVRSGRTSWEDPPFQQPPKKGGFRECFRPRPGKVYVSADYNHIELNSWGQVCLWSVGRSVMAETINAGLDPHLVTALEIFRAENHPNTPADYAAIKALKGTPEVKERRDLAKALNFGLPGGLGPPAFVGFASAQYGIEIEQRRSAVLCAAWKSRYDEAPEYFEWVKDRIGFRGEGTIQQFVSGRIRGGVNFTSAANSFFQGLTADGAKYATYLVQRACYSDKGSPLYGCRGVLMLHDEIILECPDDPDTVHFAGLELERLMVLAMAEFIPDVPAKAPPTAMRRWIKGADGLYVDGRLIVID
jgi:DNA polymerase I